MSDIAIRVERLSKRYRIGAAKRRHDTLRDHLADTLSTLWHRASRPAASDRTIWALKDVSLEVKHGQVLGIIGSNGAGKSTLLKILSRITEPTEGRVEITGAVGSLLEVGIGFHPELSGRENIYLNGAILGMKKNEVDRKFDEILSFAEVEQFIDTPVKHYSSGMYVRLAFSVAAHAEPEILIVDEVLAVGDAQFQKKCLAKIADVASAGRTVLVVSHNLAIIERLCDTAAVLASGRLEYLGTPAEAIQRYSTPATAGTTSGQYLAPEPSQHHPRPQATIAAARVTSTAADSEASYPIGAPLRFSVTCRSDSPIERPTLGIGIDNAFAQRIVTLQSTFAAPQPSSPALVSGEFQFVCDVAELALAPGEYRVKLALDAKGIPVDIIENAFGFTIRATDYYSNGGAIGKGLLLCPQHWKLIL